MTLQELNQLQYLKREIEMWEQHLASDPLPGVPRSSPMAQESNRLIQGNIEKATQEYNRLVKYVSSVSDPLVLQAMVLHFIDGKTWVDTAAYIGVCPEYIQRVIKRYLERNKHQTQRIAERVERNLQSYPTFYPYPNHVGTKGTIQHNE